MPDFGFNSGGFDDWIDGELRNVPVPRDLHARLRADRARGAAASDENTAAPLDDAQLDAMLRDVPVPLHLERSLRAIPRGYWPLGYGPQAGIWSAAASVLILITGGVFWIARQDAAPEPQQVAQSANTAPPETPADGSLSQSAPRSSTANKISQPALQAPVTVRLGAGSEPQAPSMLEGVASVGSSLRQAIEERLRASNALGSGGRFEALPALEMLEPPAARGVSPPRVRGYDLLFQLRHGEHPFVLPAAHPSLRISRVPLTSNTSSYDLAAASLAAGRLPTADAVRVEDFLAAQRYLLPPAPKSGVELHAAGCPSPLGERGPQFVQFTLQAAAAAQPNRPATRLVAVIETSATMNAAARSKMMLRALGKLTSQMSPADRLTVIGFAEAPSVLVENATRQQAEQLLVSNTVPEFAGSADLLSAVLAARDAVAALPAQENRRVLFVTASDGDLRIEQTRQAREALAELADTGTTWQAVRLTSSDRDVFWSELAEKSNGKAMTADSADELASAAIEQLTGRSPTVAKSVALRIAFNPKAVASYRLLGHEAVTLTGDAGDPLSVDLSADQTVTGMYEIWLKPSGEGDLASAELTWQDPRGGQPRRRVIPIRREQLAASFEESPAWLQQGVVAARTAEFLRGSYYLPNSRRMSQLVELAGEADVSLFKTAEYRELVRLIEQAARLR